MSNANAVVGDRLVLTKPLGTGLLATAAKLNEIGTREVEELYAFMCKLNREASRVAVSLGVRCATDITGFGLLGHASHIAQASKVTLRIDPRRVPVFAGAEKAWRGGTRTGGAERNLSFLETRVDLGPASEFQRAILVDPQTSGGLLVAVPPAQLSEYLSRVPDSVEIGEVVARGKFGLLLA